MKKYVYILQFKPLSGEIQTNYNEQSRSTIGSEDNKLFLFVLLVILKNRRILNIQILEIKILQVKSKGILNTMYKHFKKMDHKF